MLASVEVETGLYAGNSVPTRCNSVWHSTKFMTLPPLQKVRQHLVACDFIHIISPMLPISLKAVEITMSHVALKITPYFLKTQHSNEAAKIRLHCIEPILVPCTKFPMSFINTVKGSIQ